MIEKIDHFLTENLEKLIKLTKDTLGNEGHLPEWFMNELTFTILIATIIIAIYKVLKKSLQLYFSWRIRKRLYKDLSYSSFSRSDVEKATKYYIPTKYQNVSPSDDEEPGSKYIASAKNELIPLFLKEAFSLYGNDNKYYLILADTGMGKTTFMINLYLAYLKKRRMFWQPPKLNIKLYSLGDPRTLDKLKQIENKHETILLLDAFDEDSEAIIDYKDRIACILKEVDDFHDIVITSRTQFFPSEIEEPYSTGYMSFGDTNTKRNFQKLYLSVFNNNDIRKYLRKRISFFRIFRYRRALEITRKSPSLVVRPMLLSHIEDLANSKVDYHYTYEVYQVLIEKWVKREASKPGLEQKYGRNRYEELLKIFSQELAVDMYLNREKRGGYYATINSKLSQESKLSIRDLEVELLTDTESRSRSLLNRDAEGKYKFSHKSIMEYFLAKKLVEDEHFARNFDFKGNDAALLFNREMLLNEVLSPIFEYHSDRIVSKCDSFQNHVKLGIKLRYSLIKKSLFYYNSYKKVSNEIYNQELKIRSGITRFGFLYKIFVFNKLARRNIETLSQNKINLDDLIYYLNDQQLDELNKNLLSLESFYFGTNILNSIDRLLDYSKVEYTTKTKAMNFKISDINSSIFDYIINLYAEFIVFNEKLLFISLSDIKTKLFMNNQFQLIEILNNSKSETNYSDIEHLIGLSFDLFTNRYYGDVYLYSSKNPLFDEIGVSIFRLSKMMRRYLRQI